MINALFCTYPMAFHTPGGGEMQLMAYKRHLPDKDVSVTLFDPWKPDFNSYDIFHFFSCIGGSIHLCNFVKQLGIPLVITSSLWITHKNKMNYNLDEIRWQLSLADAVITNSEMESDTLADVLDLPRERFKAVYNGVENFFYDDIVPGDEFRNEFKIDSHFVLNVANVEPRKNQLGLIRAMKQFPDKKLVIMGYIRDKAYAEQVFAEGKDQVIYTGPVDNGSRTLRSAYSACDVFCLPSTLETPGLAALEAYACGSRVVVTSVGSTREYFDDRVTYADPDSADDIASAINIELNKEQKTAARKNFRWGEVVKPLRDIYLETVTKAGSKK